jgi:hypothetical protein
MSRMEAEELELVASSADMSQREPELPAIPQGQRAALSIGPTAVV